MPRIRSLIIPVSLSIFLFVGIAATHQPSPAPRNLQVLPKDISDDRLDSIMHSYNKALGVTCNFCHAPSKTYPGELEFPSDENPMKEDARKMIRLNIQINRDYFYYDSLERPEYLKVVTCITCHRGNPMPADLK